MVRLVRMIPDGSLDPEFLSPLTVGRMVPRLEKNGQVYVGKAFHPGGTFYLIRMNPDGSLDPSFHAKFDAWFSPFVGVGFFLPPVLPHQDGMLCWGGMWANDILRPLGRIIPDAPPGFALRDLNGFFNDLEYAVGTRGFEAEGAVEITVVRNGNTSGPASVRYRTEDGTALAGQNYVASAGTLEFAPFQTEALIRITLLQDDVFRGRPHFFLELHEPSVAARLDRRRKIVVHDREPGLIAGRVVTRLDGRKETEFDVTGLQWLDSYFIESSADLNHWERQDWSRQFGPHKVSFGLLPETAPELLEVGSMDKQFFRMVRP